ncbi:MAG: FRG domain-containing protein [Planctomycetota bacterium]|nr:FRG domain-containing protein [Planctomycetota bacterium]
MDKVELKTFEEFESKATVLWEDRQKKRKEKGEAFSPVLFRGQERASWKLRTTLERYSTRQYSPEDYYNVVCSVRPVVESCTGTRWKFYDKYTRNDGSSLRPPRPPQEYEFMVYLRLHGFPSPLLDWTRSFYVAAFFAFQSATPDKQDEPNVAIYAFREHGDLGKSWGNEAHIVGCGPTITTHKRHVIQQTEFTFCEKKSSDQYLYCSHEEAFKRNDEDQDILTKFIIPKAERAKVLDKLQMMNITAYSLFGSEESLLATLAYEEIERREFR